MCSYVSYANSHLAEHKKKTHTHFKSLPCSKCKKYFKTKSQLSDHMRIVHPTYKYLCPYCAYSSPAKSAIHKHAVCMHTHPNIKPYKCKYCDFTHIHAGSIHSHCRSKHVGLSPKSVQICALPKLPLPIQKVFMTMVNEKPNLQQPVVMQLAANNTDIIIVK